MNNLPSSLPGVVAIAIAFAIAIAIAIIAFLLSSAGSFSSCPRKYHDHSLSPDSLSLSPPVYPFYWGCFVTSGITSFPVSATTTANQRLFSCSGFPGGRCISANHVVVGYSQIQASQHSAYSIRHSSIQHSLNTGWSPQVDARTRSRSLWLPFRNLPRTA